MTQENKIVVEKNGSLTIACNDFATITELGKVMKHTTPTVIVDSGASVMEEKIEIGLTVTKENPDGSADVVVRFNKPAMECILQWGIVKMIE